MKRRTFLKQLGLAVSLPAFQRASRAAESSAGPTAPSHTVMSCNIRVALPEDDAAGHGWDARRDLCLDVIRAQKPDLIGFQEVLRGQMADLEKGLPTHAGFGFEGPEMDARMIGYGGIAKNPVFYSRERYELVTAGGFWLSETPHLPGSLSWESARARHVNWVRLRDRATHRQFRLLSTHLDHVSQPAREAQIKLILDEAALYAPEFPQILCGDFNAGRANNAIKSVLDAGWTNTQTAAPGPPESGPTVHGFRGEKNQWSKAALKRGPIDFIFTRGPVTTLDWRIIRDSRDGRYPSDHFFLATKLAF
ncbi:MAG TPA: endonuclease/exonuclease/phosphatase family protein [Verrucomicrobiota bacterium]|jgi:endonuclease/exonuclease/phosphatase family metal-dependent hydrolase|nr:endonuclease/exonuclease/phosphatase family protein [Verrucomicrobiota bacterium]OQB94088.1 MAG: Endonuclease/Exonuclease/phosphatase family protein [Verrucomicrobia bacterium ADurb.Bin118]HPY31445.1 endonuclease/exonuclease/phosphatase family protein [Verrucomicrobiota bacterium]HQB17444.1 endonuclease/exonuclease/phosphatase family protein [Verrucomicrobiota bacterium]